MGALEAPLLSLVALSSATQGVSGDMAIQDPPGEIFGTVRLSAELLNGGSLAVVKLLGELDLSTAPQLQTCLQEFDADGADLQLDLSGLTFCDSSGISAMVTAAKRVRKRGARFSVVFPQPAVRSVLEITGLLNYLSAPPSEEGIDGQ